MLYIFTFVYSIKMSIEIMASCVLYNYQSLFKMPKARTNKYYQNRIIILTNGWTPKTGGPIHPQICNWQPREDTKK